VTKDRLSAATASGGQVLGERARGPACLVSDAADRGSFQAVAGDHAPDRLQQLLAALIVVDVLASAGARELAQPSQSEITRDRWSVSAGHIAHEGDRLIDIPGAGVGPAAAQVQRACRAAQRGSVIGRPARQGPFNRRDVPRQRDQITPIARGGEQVRDGRGVPGRKALHSSNHVATLLARQSLRQGLWPSRSSRSPAVALVRVCSRRSTRHSDSDQQRHLEPFPIAIDIAEADIAQPIKLCLDVEQMVGGILEIRRAAQSLIEGDVHARGWRCDMFEIAEPAPGHKPIEGVGIERALACVMG